MTTRLVLIAVLGGAGALTRLGVGNAVGERDVPAATFLINVVGSFALGLLVTWGATRLSRDVASALAVGFLGAFTTFSTFTVDAALLGDAGRVGTAALYVVASVAVGLFAAVGGIALGRTLVDA
jgi:fluoride exporter